MRHLIVGMLALICASVADAAEWGPWPLAENDGRIVAAGYKHDDGGALIILCDVQSRSISLVFQEPRAKWEAGTKIPFTTLPDDGAQLSPSNGAVLGPNAIVIKAESTFHVFSMGQAHNSFAVRTGPYARIFPASGFRPAIEVVLKACGDHW